MAEKKFDAQVNYGWGLSLNMTGKAPAVAKRIFNTLADAQAYADDFNDSAIEGLVLSVVADGDNNGAYFVESIKSTGSTEPAVLVKLGSASDASDGAADALTQAKAYTDQLAEGAVKTNTDAIATLNGDAETDGSVAKAVATEQARAEAKELELDNAIAAETTARTNAIQALDATVGSQTIAEGKHVAVEVVEVDGVLTSLTVVEDDIASAQALIDEKARAEAAEKTNADAIAAETERAEEAEALLAGRVTANENEITKLNGDAETDGSVAKAVATEQARAEAKELELDNAIAAETTARQTAIANAIAGLDAEVTSSDGTHVTVKVTEVDGVITAVNVTESDIASASALTQEITDRENAILALDATVGSQTIAEGKHVAVEVVEVDGVLTSLTVVEDDIASAAVLAEVKEDVDNFFKDASFAESAKDTLKELQEYINTDAAGALAMEQAIANNKTAIEAEVARAEAAESDLTADIEAEADRAKAAEKANADAIAAETTARQTAIANAIAGLDAEVTSSDGTHVTVKVTEVDGVITAVNVTESDIASASALTAETDAREAADKAINDTIGEVETGKTLVEMIKAAEATAIAAATVVAEDSEFITIEQTGEVGKTQTYTIKTQDIASATATNAAIAAEEARALAAESGLTADIEAEAARADAAEKVNAAAIAAEKTRAEGVEIGLENRLATVEGDYVKSVEAAEGSMITVFETDQKVTLSLQWGTF